ncbi:hypothetical protein ACFONN_21345 [Dyella humi]|uniref:Nuclear transport factor 2 family protein n=1 Tax=Dyella humi TaxID=1770547 RepID=A0ABW8IFF0_9GAMM
MKLAALFTLTLAATSVQAQQATQPDTRQPDASVKGASVQMHDVGPPDAIAQLRKLAAAYNLATVKKDTSALLRFYYDENVPVTGSVSPPSFARMTEASNGKAPKLYPSNAKDQSVADTSAKATAEKMSNLTIHTDGAVASIEYDYEIPQGYGHTFWTLVDTKDAWKITSIVYSINIRSTAK